MSKINTLAFDKTGTIAYGKPAVIDIISLNKDYNEDSILQLAVIAEKFTEHPLGKAICAKANEQLVTISDPEEFKIVLGQGVTAVAANRRILIGKQKLLGNHNIDIPHSFIADIQKYENQGKTVMIVVLDHNILGFITVADKIKAKAPDTIMQLRLSVFVKSFC